MADLIMNHLPTKREQQREISERTQYQKMRHYINHTIKNLEKK